MQQRERTYIFSVIVNGREKYTEDYDCSSDDEADDLAHDLAADYGADKVTWKRI